MRANDGWKMRNWLAAVACCGCLAGQPIGAADQAADQAATAAVPLAAPAQQHQPALEQRVALMAAELGLDETQKAELRRILVDQRAQIMRLWGDNSVPAASRVGATRVISEQTGNRIRALLNEEQKVKYNKPRQPRDATAAAASPSVEDWMKTANPR